jgi:hypothetical protein
MRFINKMQYIPDPRMEFELVKFSKNFCSVKFLSCGTFSYDVYLFNAVALNNCIDDFHAFYYMAKNTVLVIQPRCSLMCNKKLTSVSTWASIGHGKDTGTRCEPVQGEIRL